LRISEAKLIVEKMPTQCRWKEQETAEKTVRQFILMANEPTADLLTRRTELHEKNAWMLRSTLYV